MKNLAVLFLLLVGVATAKADCILDHALATWSDPNAISVLSGTPPQTDHFKNFSLNITKFSDGVYRMTACGGVVTSGTTWSCQSGNFTVANGTITATGILINNDLQHPQSEKIGTCTAKSARFSFAYDAGKHDWMYTSWMYTAAGITKGTESWEFSLLNNKLNLRFGTKTFQATDYLKASLGKAAMVPMTDDLN